MVRTGSCRAQPRSLAGVGTTAPRSGQLRGRGSSQCHPRLTLAMSWETPPTKSASRLIPISPEYHGISVDPAVHQNSVGAALRGGDVAGVYHRLEVLELPENRVPWRPPEGNRRGHGVFTQSSARA